MAVEGNQDGGMLVVIVLHEVNTKTSPFLIVLETKCFKRTQPNFLKEVVMEDTNAGKSATQTSSDLEEGRNLKAGAPDMAAKIIKCTKRSSIESNNKLNHITELDDVYYLCDLFEKNNMMLFCLRSI